MAEPTEQFDFQAALDRLTANAEASPWPERLVMVKALADALADRGPNEIASQVLLLLADDAKWEVRKEVAECLPLVSDDDFPRLAAKLSKDSNQFVLKATARALDRRRRGQETVQRKRRGLDQVQDQYANIEKMHGSVAAEKARQMAERLYDVLVGATVHDMRNILGPLKSGVSALLGQLADGGVDARLLEKALTKMGHQAEMLERLMEDMRAYSQPTPEERRRERLLDVVREAHGMVMDTFRATGRDPAGVTIALDVPESLTVEMSRYQVVRAISNILKNAYEAFATDPRTFAAGQVHLQARPVNGDRIEILVRDNGMGLSPDELADVRRFVPGRTSKKTYGTGFGLPTAKRKIEDHGGLLAIDSVEDEGTVVTIILPVEAGGDDE